jgi:shikimate dehydrogenase
MKYPTRLVLLGSPVAHSLSPTFQNAALDIAGLPVRYEALDVPAAALDDTLARLALEGAAGNVTVPHKIAVHDRCSVLTPSARRAGAVNTFWFSDGTLHGDNTDVGGFTAAVTALLGGDPLPRSLILLGAGGAAAGVCTAAEQWGAISIVVIARSRGTAHRLAARFPDLVTIVDSLHEVDAQASRRSRRGQRDAQPPLVVNATPLGFSADDPLPIAIALLPDESPVLDLVYARGETRLVRDARAAGHRASDGLTMLLEQGALAFERWFGFAPDRDAMRRSVQ